jgi:imidazolonepropionase-like amidohydrolase
MKRIKLLPTASLYLVFFILFSLIAVANAQYLPEKSVRFPEEGRIVIGPCTVFPEPGKVMNQAYILVENGKITALFSAFPSALPQPFTRIEINNAFVYPSFIDLNSALSPAEPKSPRQRSPRYESSRDPLTYYWNDAVRPDNQIQKVFQPAEKDIHAQLAEGFGLGLVHQTDGVVRGTGMLVRYASNDKHKNVIETGLTQHFSLEKGSSAQAFPSSQTGAIALLRQWFIDIEWYKQGSSGLPANLLFETAIAQAKLPAVFHLANVHEILRLIKLNATWKLSTIFIGSGDEYQRIPWLLKYSPKLVVPLDFPKPYNLKEPFSAEKLDLTQLMHWEAAPSNVARLLQAKLPVSISGGKESKDFLERLRLAHFSGADSTELIRSLTTVPAEWLNLKQVGKLQPGSEANFFILSAPIFGHDKPALLAHYIQGEAAWQAPLPKSKSGWHDLRGTWKSICSDWPFANNKNLKIEGNFAKPSGKFQFSDTTSFSLSFQLDKDVVSFSFFSLGLTGHVRFSGNWRNDSLISGFLFHPEGMVYSIDLKRASYFSLPQLDSVKDDRIRINPFLNTVQLRYPFHPYGFTTDELPAQNSWVLRNATVWTSETPFELPNCDVHIENGKIKSLGTNLKVPAGIPEIDGSGKFLTAGIIDEHSHIALRKGVNEGATSMSAMVRMGDVINPDDPHIYHQLAGGVTAAQLLHGSANAIGGQSALIKLAWGESADDFLIPNAPGFIKFALGENVKQSNWGEAYTVRYPQTRMGVESLLRDAFERAVAYKNADKKAAGFRRDLLLETLVEILDKKRFITCHSYVRSEVLMLMQVAEDFGFRINTFTHILEGYKVAEAMARHGAAGSTFSDWWAYKMEVQDAIPYNAACMHRAGVVVALNSDDASMGSRMNQEAAKAMKYGGMSKENAWAMITSNPAKMLRLNDRIGSIAPGKDADLVLWSHEPLSMQARALFTWVDGKLRFSRDRDENLTRIADSTQNQLIRKMLDLNERGVKTQPITIKKNSHYHCETLGYDE